MSANERAWPGAVCAISWAVFGLAVLIAYSPGGPLDRAVGPILALPLATLAALGAVTRPSGTRATTSPAIPGTNAWTTVRLGLAAGAALLLVPLSAAVLGGSAPSPPLDGLDVRRFLPGSGEGWTYLAAAALTVAATVPVRRRDVGSAMALVAAATLAAGGVVAWNGAVVGAGPDAGAAACGERLVAPSSGLIDLAGTGDLDGAPLGSVVAKGATGGPLLVRYATRWGAGTVEAGGADPAALGALVDTTLGHDERLTADDLGIDLLNGSPARHCQVVIDGRSAVAGFVVLRWLTGADERRVDAGAELEAWRGTLDYWIVPGPFLGGKSPSARPVLVAVSVDGQPPNWPFPGIRASLRAASWFGVP